MQITNKVEQNILSVTYELNEVEMNIMNHLKEHNYIEFRSNHNQKDNTDSSSQFTEKQLRFLARTGFIKRNLDSWHTTYILAHNGKVFLGIK